MFLKALLDYVIALIKRKKHKWKLYQHFQLEKTPKIGLGIIIFIALIDMFSVFFLFWPANVIPITSLINLLQLYIPMTMVLRLVLLGHKHYKRHWIAGLLIFVACVISIIWTIVIWKSDDGRLTDIEWQELKHSLYFCLSILLAVFSLSLKESIVRQQPINNEKFNLKISVA